MANDDSASSGHRKRQINLATVTPLASIFGSGFLIVVPTLERGVGVYALPGMAAVLVLAWFVGEAVRGNATIIEPRFDNGTLDRTSSRVKLVSDGLIVIAYVISVTLYLRILAQYLVGYFDGGAGTHEVTEQWIATGVILFIAIVGVTRGFAGLGTMERIALISTLALVVVLVASFAVNDVGRLADGSFALPPGGDSSLLETAALLGGIMITVQGFETIRYTADEFDLETRLSASRRAQIIAAVVYLAFVAVATPLMATATGGQPDTTLLEMTQRVVAFAALPLVISAILSQFSASVADTIAAVGNMRHLGLKKLPKAAPYAISAVAAIGLNWVIGINELVAVASRAFAAYYAVQAAEAARLSHHPRRKVGMGLVAVVMALIAVFAQPAG